VDFAQQGLMGSTSIRQAARHTTTAPMATTTSHLAVSVRTSTMSSRSAIGPKTCRQSGRQPVACRNQRCQHHFPYFGIRRSSTTCTHLMTFCYSLIVNCLKLSLYHPQLLRFLAVSTTETHFLFAKHCTQIK